MQDICDLDPEQCTLNQVCERATTNDDGKFSQTAGSEDGQYHVNQVGWSYGGQWGDFDNNSQLDLYVPTGFYTAPEEIDTQVDT